MEKDNENSINKKQKVLESAKNEKSSTLSDFLPLFSREFLTNQQHIPLTPINTTLPLTKMNTTLPPTPMNTTLPPTPMNTTLIPTPMNTTLPLTTIHMC